MLCVRRFRFRLFRRTARLPPSNLENHSFCPLPIKKIGFRGNDLDLTEMGLARTLKTNRSNLELLDIFNSTVSDDIKCRDLSVEEGWTNACPAQLVAALEEDLLMSDEEEPDIRSTHSPSRLADYEDFGRSESESGSSDSSSSKSYQCSSPNEPCAAGQLEEVEELERLVQLEEFDQSEEDSGVNRNQSHIKHLLFLPKNTH